MKICLISNLYPPYVIGGSEMYVARIAKKLSLANEVIVITIGPYKNLSSLNYSFSQEDKIKVYRFYPLNIYQNFSHLNRPALLKSIWHILDIWNPHAYFTLRRILCRERPDVVHTHNLSGFSLSAIAAIKKSGLPLVTTCHDFALICPYATLTCPLRKQGRCRYPVFPCQVYRRFKRMAIADKPDIVIFLSPAAEEVYLDNGFFKNSKREILYSCFEPPDRESFVEREEAVFNILFVGRLVEHKGAHILIQALRNLRGERIKLHIVGEGTKEEDLRNQAAGEERIIFHGRVSDSQLWRMYKLADVTVFPSLWQETFGAIIMESFLAGVPVIGSNIGATAQLIKQGENGFIFTPGNVEELTKILEKIVSRPDLLQKLKAGAKKSAAQFDTGEHIKRLEEIYKTAAVHNRY